MFTKRIIMLITTTLLIGSLVTGCDWFSGQSNAEKSLDKLQSDLVEAEKEKIAIEEKKEHSNYTYEQKMLFVNQMKRELIEIQQELDKLVEKATRSKNEAKAESKKRLEALREELEQVKANIEEVQNVDESKWENAKTGFRNANAKLKESFDKTRQWLSDKIEP